MLADPSSNPEEMLARRYESKALACTVATLSPVQMRRLLMRDVALLPIREIAEGGGCFERAIKYGLSRSEWEGGCRRTFSFLRS